MITEANIPTLASLEYIPYLDAEGQLPAQFQGKVGVYAIFDKDKVLQYVGYSRDVDLSLKQHIVRQATKCYWVKVHLSDRPIRTILESIKDAWISKNSRLIDCLETVTLLITSTRLNIKYAVSLGFKP